MPYLQLDAPHHYAVDVKRALARRLGESYARIMQTTPELVTVAFRELGEGGVWCCGAGEPEPAALLSCDIRRGPARATGRTGAGVDRRLCRDARAAQRPTRRGVYAAHGRRDVSRRARLGQRMDAGRGDERGITPCSE